MTTDLMNVGALVDIATLLTAGFAFLKAHRSNLVEKVVIDEMYEKRTEEIAAKVVNEKLAAVTPEVIQQRSINDNFERQLAQLEGSINTLSERISNIPSDLRNAVHDGISILLAEMRTSTPRTRKTKSR
jgi:septal ring factor EnvC (AmiA/AmiB activator)